MSDSLEDYSNHVLRLITEKAELSGFKVIKESNTRLTLQNSVRTIRLFIYNSGGIKNNPYKIWMGIKEGSVNFLNETKNPNDVFLIIVNKNTKNFLVLPYKIEQQFMKFKQRAGWDSSGRGAHSFDVEISNDKARFLTREGTSDEKYYDCTEYLDNLSILFNSGNKSKQNSILLLIDEDSLGVVRYLSELNAKIIKVGDIPELPKGTEDPIVAKYAKANNCIVVTRDDNMVKACDFYEVKVISIGMNDLAKKIVNTLSK